MSSAIRVMEGIIRLAYNLAAILLAIAAVLVFYQVITRFVLGESAVWSEVLARAVIVWGVFLVMGPAIRYSKMIPIDVIRGLFTERMQIWIIRLVSVAVTIFLLVLIWYGYQMTLRVVDQKVAMLEISVAWLYVSIPFGATLAIFGVILAHIDSETAHRQISDVSE